MGGYAGTATLTSRSGHAAGQEVPALTGINAGRARDDVLIASWSGLMIPRQAIVPGQGVLIGHGARVSCPEGDLGTLERVLVDPDTDEVRALVIGRKQPQAGTVRVPASWVATVGEDEIVLAWRPDSG